MVQESEMSFDARVQIHQIKWRRSQGEKISQQQGVQIVRGKEVRGEWILPKESWTDGLWTEIRDSLPLYLHPPDEESPVIQRHDGSHNLKSSWILCANLYFPFASEEGRTLLAEFLREEVKLDVTAIQSVELEFQDDQYPPWSLLGEPKGQRGRHQTSPDLGITVTSSGRTGLILVENKYVEHSFYDCSGSKKENDNEHSDWCKSFEKIYPNWQHNCWQANWEKGRRKNRKYWQYIKFSEVAQTLNTCPAVSAGCQLFRQQALAEALAETGKYEFVASCVAWDDRNEDLRHCLRSTGIDDFAADWGALFKGQAIFTTWAHQDWIRFVSLHRSASWHSNWLDYVTGRYDYAAVPSKPL